MRGQISLDFLFAVTLMALLTLNLVYIGTSQRTGAEAFDVTTKLKVFSIDVRDSVTKVYSIGSGFEVKKEIPFELKNGDYVIVRLNNATDSVQIAAQIGGKEYYVEQKLQVPLYKESVILLQAGSGTSFWIRGIYNETEGRVDVVLSP